MSQPHLGNPAEIYESYFVPAMFAQWAALLLGHAAPQVGDKVLDIACGTGIAARQVAPLVGIDGKVVGIDINPAMLAVARTLEAPAGAPVTWQQGSAQALPFSDASFDLVLCQHGLQFFPDRELAVREMHRVLRPGGRALAIVLQDIGRHPVFATMMSATAQQLDLPLSQVTIPFVLADAGTLRSLYLAAGFKGVDIAEATNTVRYPNAGKFVPLSVLGSAVAVPAFAQLGAPEQAALLENVRQQTEPVLAQYRNGDAVVFPMFAHMVEVHK